MVDICCYAKYLLSCIYCKNDETSIGHIISYRILQWLCSKVNHHLLFLETRIKCPEYRECKGTLFARRIGS